MQFPEYFPLMKRKNMLTEIVKENRYLVKEKKIIIDY